MRDLPVAETSTWQQVTLLRGRHPCLRWDLWTRNPSKQKATDTHFRPCCHRDRLGRNLMPIVLLTLMSIPYSHTTNILLYSEIWYLIRHKINNGNNNNNNNNNKIIIKVKRLQLIYLQSGVIKFKITLKELPYVLIISVSISDSRGGETSEPITIYVHVLISKLL